MLRPSRPIIRPFKSSLGRSTTDTVVSIVCSAALRWMASVMYWRAFAPGLLARLGVEALDEVRRIAPRIRLDVLQQEVLGFFRRQAGQAFQLVLLGGDELLVFRRRGGRGLLALGDRLGPGLKVPVLAIGGCRFFQRAPPRAG